MENISEYRYCIAMKKGRKRLNMIGGWFMILISIIFIIAIAFMQEVLPFTVLAIYLLIIPLPLLIFGIIGVVTAKKRVEVYKGKVIYHIGFKNKEYRMSDIKTSKIKSETYRTGLDYGNIVPTYSYDKLTVFYDQKGEKIFKFGLAYDNVERLKADVNNTQKSMAKQHNKK